MLLETLDLLKNDVIIFSENKFDFGKNFKIIYKQSEIKSPKRIDFFEVCNFVIDPFPKNLIVYRLLANVNSIDAFSSKYGFFINCSTGLELIYFDPIFALNDISFLQMQIDPNLFRFKIQQVGFTSLPSKDNEAFYEEVYAFDLKSDEAKNQNDKVYAKAIFALDDSFIDDEADNLFPGVKNNSIRNFSEDKSNKINAFNKPVVSNFKESSQLNEEKIQKLKEEIRLKDNKNVAETERFDIDKSAFIKKKSFNEFIQNQMTGNKLQKTLLGNAEEYKKREQVVFRFKK